MPSPYEVIRQIREQCGISQNAERPSGWMAENLANALNMLSRELYNYDGHFLFELLQNADDNRYAHDVEPMIDIRIATDGITIQNNETGFTAENVLAICAVGKSTKRSRKTEAIGEKGIGFKAVFKVSERPEVHSNGFHFCFDMATHGELGMVLPEWLPDCDRRYPEGLTTLYLPTHLSVKVPEDLISKFEAELPLFLRRLKRMRITDDRIGESVELHRTDSGNVSTVERKTTKGRNTKTTRHCFFRFERSCDMSDAGDAKRGGIDTSLVVVAIPLDDDGSASPADRKNVFAFLPVKESGLPVVAHADFILNTSREDIVRDRPWNQCLRDNLGHATADAILAMQSVGPLGYTALRVLCDPKSIQDPFLCEIMRRAIDELRAKACVPGSDGKWLTPPEALRRDPAKLADLLDDSDLRSAMDKSFVSRAAKSIDAALGILKVEFFTFETLMNVCAKETWIESRSIDWLRRLYWSLAGELRTAGRVDQLRKSPIFRLTTGRHAAAGKGTIYRSLRGRRQYGFERDLQVLHPDILARELKRSDRELIESLLTKLDVLDADPVGIIDGHIVPQHERNELDSEALLAHAHFILDNAERYANAKGHSGDPLRDLGKRIYLLTREATHEHRLVDHASELYVGRAYGDPNDMEGLLGSLVHNQLIDEDYLARHDPPEPGKWRQLFVKLGANELPRVTRSDDDYCPSQELVALFERNDLDKNQRLVDALDSHYESWTKPKLRCESGLATTFCQALSELKLRDRRGEPRVLTGAFLDTESNRAVFGSGVPFLSWVPKHEDLAADLGVVCRPSVGKAIEQLEALSAGGTSDVNQVTRLYRYLEQHWETAAQQIRRAFASKPIVFLKRSGRDELASTFLHKCRWHMPPQLQPYSDLVAIRNDWSQHGDFFRNQLLVTKWLDGEDLLAILGKVGQSKIDPSKDRDLIETVYRELSEHLKRSDDTGVTDHAWLKKARVHRMIFTSRGDWRVPGDDVYEADDQQLAMLFSDSMRVRFIGVNNDHIPRCRILIDALGIRKISSADRIPPDWDTGEPDEQLRDQVRRRVRDVVRIAYVVDNAGYEKAKRDGRMGAMRELSVRAFYPLEMDVSIANEVRSHRFPAHLHFDNGSACLLVDCEERQSWIYLGESIARFLGLASQCADLISMVLGASDEREVARIFEQKRLAALPESEFESLHVPASDEDDTWHRPEEPVPMNYSSGPGPRGGTNTSTTGGLGKAQSKLPGQVSNADAPRASGTVPVPTDKKTAANSAGSGQRLDTSPPTTPDLSFQATAAARRKPGRLVSYAEPLTWEDEDNQEPEGQRQRQQVDRAAIDFVLNYERSAGRHAKEMDHSNPGYDIESAAASDAVPTFIEVKGLSAEWGERGVVLSRTQFEFSLLHKERSWLYVVEFALDPNRRRLWRVQGPASKANRFGFDFGWRNICEEAEEITMQEAALQEGARYSLEGGSSGTIVSIAARGAIYIVKVKSDSGALIERTGTLQMHYLATGGIDGEAGAGT